jgi:xylulokinase
MVTIGIDLGSSSIKLSVFDAVTGKAVKNLQVPDKEMAIDAPQPGWAEQDPNEWWRLIQTGIPQLIAQSGIDGDEVAAIGITYQMHGLVCVDSALEAVRPAIIWCDSRAVDYGNKAFNAIGKDKALKHLLNSPGNFTAAKLAWVKEHEPDIYAKIFKIMLPGDFIAMKLTGQCTTTFSGLSEGILWDFQQNEPATMVLDHFGFDPNLISQPLPQFGDQGTLLPEMAAQWGLSDQVKITYRAGDQPNNAFSLHVLQPGEVAATAGTSGVVYGVTDQINYDPLSRVNTFLHVNHTSENPRLGILLCINGVGILNSWIRRNFGATLTFEEMNQLGSKAPVGSEGVLILPFGNGAERMLENLPLDAQIIGINFNIHKLDHIIRAAHEGIAFAFAYGMEIMQQMGIDLKVIRAGKANLFLSPIFVQTLSTLTSTEINLYNTDGSLGAARGAAVGAGLYQNAINSPELKQINCPELKHRAIDGNIYQNMDDAFKTLEVIEKVTPIPSDAEMLKAAYQQWKHALEQQLTNHK